MRSRWFGTLCVLIAAAALLVVSSIANASGSAQTSCPNGGTVRFGVEPYDTGPKFAPAYQTLAKAIGKHLGCKVQLFITQNYTAEIEAMRAKKLEVGEFGPLGYVFAAKIANAKPVATFGDAVGKPLTYTAALWVPNDSTIRQVADLKGHTIAFADPASTSGNLFPRYALLKANLNPDKDVKIQFAGSHTASMLALVNGKVDAAELNSQEQATAQDAGQFDPAKFRRIWVSAPIPNDPITVRGDLPKAFRAAFKKAVLSLTQAETRKVMAEAGGPPNGKMVPQTDKPYQQIRDLAAIEHLDLKDVG
jgi:phosphonate transport system substrate-binding protein